MKQGLMKVVFCSHKILREIEVWDLPYGRIWGIL